jgi:hypothetical protein
MKLASILFLIFSFSAFSATVVEKHTDLETVKLACKDPGAVHNQLPPSDIKVACKAYQCKWMDAPTPGTFSSPPSTYEVCSAMMTNKPGIHVGKSCRDFGGTPTTFECPVIEESCAKIVMSKPITCEEVMGITDLNIWCQAVIADDVASNPDIVVWEKTGHSINLCGGAPVPTPQDPGQDPGQDPAARTTRPRQR